MVVDIITLVWYYHLRTSDVATMLMQWLSSQISYTNFFTFGQIDVNESNQFRIQGYISNLLLLTFISVTVFLFWK